jgi:hypothetical protein
VRVTPSILAILAPLLFANQAYAEDSALSQLPKTTGVVVTRGWETNLVKSDPNLGHWHWNAMYSFPSARPKGSVHQNSESEHKSQVPVSHYMKPIHVALPKVAHAPVKHNEKSASTNTSLTYSTPNQDKGTAAVALSYATPSKSAYSNPIVCSTQANVHGKVLTKRI